MNLHIKTGLGIKNYVWDLNSDVENENFLTDFSWQIWAKNTKIIFSSESAKTKEHEESNSCEKCYFSISAFYKINFWPILKKLSQKIDFLHFPHFEIFAHNLCIDHWVFVLIILSRRPETRKRQSAVMHYLKSDFLWTFFAWECSMTGWQGLLGFWTSQKRACICNFFQQFFLQMRKNG